MVTYASPYIEPSGRALSPEEVNARQQAIRAAGYMGEFGAGGADAFLMQQFGSTATPVSSVARGDNGVVPMSVEPLNPAERAGYSTLARGVDISGMQQGAGFLSEMLKDPQAFAAKFTNPQSTAQLQQAQELITRGVRPVTGEMVEAKFNPYMANMQALLDDYGQRAANKLQANMPGSRSFGTTSQAAQLSSLSRDLLNQKGQLQYAGYNDAYGRAFDEGGRDIAGAQALQQGAGMGQDIFANAAQIGAGGATSLSNLAQNFANAQITNAQNQIGTGRDIRNYNQGVANQVAGNVNNMQNYDLNQLNNLAGMLGQISGTSQITPTGSTPSTGQKIGGITGLLGDWVSKMSGKPQSIQQAGGNTANYNWGNSNQYLGI
ncbi:MAG TPA: hypothetical protein VLA40_14885 [Rheinheimera sp.]|nr:hypothetical protein [Rheinheimera sp.]